MSYYSKYFLGAIISATLLLASCTPEPEKNRYAIAIHGGAGSITREYMTPEKEKLYEAALSQALDRGNEILEDGGSSVDAVEAAIRIMEDSPMFNAGKGSVFSELGRNEMDASIMEGKDGNAGAVAGVRHIRNPISAAREVMENSKHVMLIGEGAEKFAAEKGLEMADSSYFYTEDRWKSFTRRKEHGTVGAVALDKAGNLAAGTSTGGMTNKMTGRVGDSPIIGAGTFARNSTCALSATGHGEYFIRNVVCYDISALMEYRDLSLQHACQYMIHDKLKLQSADAGIIGIDNRGNISMEFNTAGMFRGYMKSNGEKVVLMYE
jgi:beta-aspartyl-peptidase (threonine type)